MSFDFKTFSFNFSFANNTFDRVKQFVEKRAFLLVFFLLSVVSVASFLYYLSNGLGLSYNDARSHLDIGRRVVENLKPGFAQLGSVWLPLPHLLMTPTIWNDFMWHSGLSGALLSMISFVATGLLIYKFLERIGVNLFGRFVGVLVFAINLNVLYMQSTAMTELLLLATMTAGVYELMMWHKEETTFRLVKSAFWIMLATLIRYDGWFLFAFATALIFLHTIKRYGYKVTEGVIVLFCTLGGFGVFLWLFWNQMIFNDPLYFAFGEFSANAQQSQLEDAGVLNTKKNLPLSIQTYYYAMVYNAGMISVILGALGALLFWFDKRIMLPIRIASLALLAPLFFNILALFLGHSVLFVQGLSGSSWFNVRYGLMMMPSLAVFIGYLTHRVNKLRYVFLFFILFVSLFSFVSRDAVTIDDAVVGASGKNVSEVSGWLKSHVTNDDNYVLISVASHDAIIFSSGLPMSKFIHEGTGDYWDLTIANPERYAKWIIMRTNDNNDLTFRSLETNPSWKDKYRLVSHFPFADIYELKTEYQGELRELPKLKHNK